NFVQTATVNLTVTNNYGCSNTITKDDIIRVHPSIRAGFGVDKTIVCTAPGSVQFSNSSTGPGILSYQWDFGDGNTSTDIAPAHMYNQRGIYTVKLTVTSSEGCTDVLTRNAYINVANFTTDFQYPSLICTDGYVYFNNTSTPMPGQCTWVFDGVNGYTT